MKNNKCIFKIKHSIFAKLVLVLVITGIFIHFIIGSFFFRMFAQEHRVGFRKNLQVYTDYIIHDIGLPPDLNKAKDIAAKTSLRISIVGENLNWMSGDIKERMKLFHMRSIDAKTKIGWKRGKFILIKRTGGYTFSFYPDENFGAQGNERHLLGLILIITTLFFVMHLVLKRVLRPIALLSKGVQEITNGNLDYRVPVLKDDDLGELTKSFNNMNDQITNMIRAKEQLLLDVSHELRSPITRMKVSLEFLENHEIKQSLHEDISELEIMITEILETERLSYHAGKLQREACEMYELITQVIDSMPGETTEIRVDESLRNLTLDLDREKVKRAIRNILENAVKYSGTEKKPVLIMSRLAENQNYVEIEIKDQGIGIPEHELPFIFEPFYRVDRSRSRETGGYGLGMSLCKKIMEAHGGEIEINSTLHEGTSVILRFYTESGQ